MNKIRNTPPIAFFSVLVCLIALSLSALGQAAPKPLAPNVQELRLSSKLMGADIPYRVVTPPGYKADLTARYPVIYLLHGLRGNFANWTVLTRLSDYAAKHSFIVIMPDGGNGWYTDSMSKPTDKYESYITKELIPEIDKTYRTVASRDSRVIAGLSMGGYGALKFGLKYPEMFSLVGTFSGALKGASYTEKNATTAGRGIDLIMGPEDSEIRKANDVFKLIMDMTPDKQKSLPFIYQSCGTEDFLIQNNRDFLALMNEKKVPHEYREHPGAHDWDFWGDQIREFLDVASRRVKK